MNDKGLPDDTPLGEARVWLIDGALAGGVKCPCCGQRAQVYRRTINSGMAKSLASMYAQRGTEWINVPDDVGARSREEGKLRYWGLVTEEGTPRTDGGRNGWWRVTEAGERFVLGQATVPKYALVYDGNCLGLVGDEVRIEDCVKDKFNLRKLLNGG